jgi:hypothetical protein
MKLLFTISFEIDFVVVVGSDFMWAQFLPEVF